MSYTLFVWSQQRPTEEQIRSFVRAHSDLKADGSFAGNFLVEAQTAEGPFPLFIVDPPGPLDPEDYEDVLEAAGLSIVPRRYGLGVESIYESQEVIA